MRMIGGAVLVLIGLTVLAAAVVSEFRPGVWLAIGLCAGGAFAIFEGRKGWCAARAMGLKTPW